jgi:hypothetical protein
VQPCVRPVTRVVAAQKSHSRGTEIAKQLPEPQIFTRELVDRSAAHQLHSSLDLGPHQAKGPLNASLTGRRERIEVKASDSDGFRPERKRLQDVGSALDSSVHGHIDAIAHGIHDFSQLIECGSRAVQLPTAMVGQHTVQPISTARFASATDIMPFRQN